MRTRQTGNTNRSQTRRRLGVAAIVLTIAAAPLAAEAPPPAPTTQPVTVEQTSGPVHVEASVDRDRVGIAQPFELHIRIEAEKGVAVGTPDYKDILGPFEILKSDTKKNVDCDDLHDCREIVLTLQAALPGDLEIPALQFAYRDDRVKMDGSHRTVKDQFQLDPIPINVENSLSGVKGPASLPMPFTYKLLWWGLGILAGLVVIAFVVRWWIKRPRKIPIANVVPQLPPYEWAMSELNRLIEENLLGQGKTQEFYYRINLLLRQYIERRFLINAGEQTSEEFIRSLQAMVTLSAEQRETLRAFVAACDPVKYAKQIPNVEETDWVLHSAREFINATRHESFVVQPPPIVASPAEAPR